jgi:phospholipase/lecithinase/hemolysin
MQTNQESFFPWGKGLQETFGFSSFSFFFDVRFLRATSAVLIVLLAMVFPVAAQNKADLSRLVVVGDSLSAGFQNGSLLDSQQVHGYANVIAQQAGVNLNLPLIAPPGIPNVLVLVSVGPPPTLSTAPGTSVGRENPLLQTFDLAVPGANLHDVLATLPSVPIDDLTDLILGLPGLLAPQPIALSQVGWAEALQPSTIVIWVGNEDALGAVIAADPSLLTPASQFQTDYKTLMDDLSQTGATLIVANIPDVTTIPFLTSAEQLAQVFGQSLNVIEALLGLGPGDVVIPDAFPIIEEILMNPLSGPLPDAFVLRAVQIAEIKTAINAYNSTIATEAQSHGAAVVDINSLLNQIREHGIVVNGQRLTTSYLGGIYSLDGVHPTNTGFAIVANEFIKALNRNFDAEISPVALAPIAATDPLILPGVGHPPSALGRVDPQTLAALRCVLVH